MAKNGAQVGESLTNSQKQSKYPPSRLAGLNRFQSGQSGNPGGNYKKTPKFNNTYERLLRLSPKERETYKPQNGVEEIALATINRAVQMGSELAHAANKAAEIIADRVDGKPEQRKTVETISTQRIELNIIIQLRAVARLDGKEMTHEDALLELAKTQEKLERAQAQGLIEAIEAEYEGQANE